MMNTKILWVLCAFFFAITDQTLADNLFSDVTDVVAVEEKRIQLNRNSVLSTTRSGDEFVFKLGLDFIQQNNSLSKQIAFIAQWGNPTDPTRLNAYWRDVSSLYKYFASLQASSLERQGKLPHSLQSILIPHEHPSREIDFLNYLKRKNHDRIPDFFNGQQTSFSIGKIEILANGVQKTDVLANDKIIGFLISGNELRLDFLFVGKQKINYHQLPVLYPDRTIIADFPLPMHTAGGKLT